MRDPPSILTVVAVAVVGLKADAQPITPCGRCRQVLNEVAALGSTDPLVLCVSKDDVRRVALSALLPVSAALLFLQGAHGLLAGFQVGVQAIK